MTSPGEQPVGVSASEPASVLVCRGCCCGTTAKLPGVDHDGHLRRLREAVAGTEGAKIRTVDCLGPCELANVVVVRRGTRRWWFGGINEDVAIDALARWVADPASDPPSELDALHIDRRRLPNRRQLAPEQGDDLADWLATAMTHGTWTIGVGAIAEFDTANATIERRGLTVTARTSTGALD